MPDGSDDSSVWLLVKDLRSDLGDIGFKFRLHATHRQHVEDTLALLQNVNQLTVVGADLHALAFDDEVGRGDVGGDLFAQVFEHLADLFQLDAGIEQLLDRL